MLVVAIALLLLAQGALSQNNCSSVDPFATAEKRLRRLLFCNYDPAVIPLNPPDVTHVLAEVSLDLKHLAMVHEYINKKWSVCFKNGFGAER
jgi:hypothetical protein